MMQIGALYLQSVEGPGKTSKGEYDDAESLNQTSSRRGVYKACSKGIYYCAGVGLNRLYIRTLAAKSLEIAMDWHILLWTFPQSVAQMWCDGQNFESAVKTALNVLMTDLRKVSGQMPALRFQSSFSLKKKMTIASPM